MPRLVEKEVLRAFVVARLPTFPGSTPRHDVLPAALTYPSARSLPSNQACAFCWVGRVSNLGSGSFGRQPGKSALQQMRYFSEQSKGAEVTHVVRSPAFG
jgi:hypothetical protein